MYLRGNSRINEKNNLEIGGVDTTELVKQYGTPLYVLDEQEIRARMRCFTDTFKELNVKYQVAYASKALCTMAMCRITDEEGLALDVVSGGELYTAIKSGFPMERVHFHGNNKSIDEIELAIDNNIGAIIIDNLYEIDLIEKMAELKKKRVNALIRVTPGIEAHTHEYIQTGQEDSKFGFNLLESAKEAVFRLYKSESINLIGLHFHIGSQIFEMAGFEKAIERIADFYKLIKDEFGLTIPILNTGGGFGIRYTEEDQPLPIKEYVNLLVDYIKYHFIKQGLDIPEIWIEPGRIIVGEAGTTLYTIGSIKEIPNIRKYISIDGGMGDNPRPALYQAKYEATIANRMISDDNELVSVAGRTCESGDMLIWDINLNQPRTGDILAVFSTGAYNYSMASNYNRFPKPAMVLVRDGEAELIIKRETYEDLLRNDLVPERLVNSLQQC